MHFPLGIRTRILVAFITPTIVLGGPDQFQADIPNAVVERLDNAKAKRIAGHPDEALQDLRAIVTEYPEYYRAVYNLGLTMADMSGKDKTSLDQAISVLETARNIRDQKSLKDYSIYNSLGWYYGQAGRGTEAERAYQVALKHSSANTADTNRRLYTNLGIFYFERGDLEHAQQYLQIAVETYQSETARKFLELNENVRKKTEVSESMSYRAKLSHQDKTNSKGAKFVDDIRQKEGAQAAVVETLLQDRANFYRFHKRDAEDQPSPGLETTATNRVEFLKRTLKFVDISADECLDQEPVVSITLTKNSIRVSRSQ